ncbi:MAG: hypothetical protein ACTSPY_15850 [Candidatus Helarchaeota archaeon]
MCAKFIVIQDFPIDKSLEFGKKYLKIYKKFPVYIKIIANSPFITTDDKYINIYTLLEISDQNIGEGLKDISLFFDQYNEIEGHSWKIQTLMKRREALGIVGLSLNDENNDKKYKD